MTERLEPLSTRMEEELRHRSEQLHALLEEAPLAVVLLDADFRIAQVNPAARPSFGDVGDLIGRDYGEVLHALWPDEVADELVRIHRHTLETGEPFHEPEPAGVPDRTPAAPRGRRGTGRGPAGVAALLSRPRALASPGPASKPGVVA